MRKKIIINQDVVNKDKSIFDDILNHIGYLDKLIEGKITFEISSRTLSSVNNIQIIDDYNGENIIPNVLLYFKSLSTKLGVSLYEFQEIMG